MRTELLKKVRALQKVKFNRNQYQPNFLANMEKHLLAEKDIGRMAEIMIKRTFDKHYPRGV